MIDIVIHKLNTMLLTKSDVNRQSGQVLLVLVLLIALMITVLSSVSYRLTTETQSTKSQEENVQVLAAADSGIEKGISMLNDATTSSIGTYQYNDPDIGLTDLPGIDAARSRVILTDTTASQFVSTEVSKDDQYTFYVSDYPNFTTSYNGNLVLYFGSDGAGTCANPRTTPALEVSIIYGPDSDRIERLLYEVCTSGYKINGPYNNNKILPNTAATTLRGVGFSYNTTNRPLNMSLYPNAKMVIVRSMFAKSRIGFATGGVVQLPSQGKLIRAEAISKSGVSKVVTLSQSFPQIPADFFVTTF